MNKTRPSNTLRIIGGQWRGRKLQFPDGEGLRPTPDRVRETLFNWLAPVIHGARCLDAFSGSGALGLEALSRGAASATLLDSHPAAIKALQQHAQTLGTRAANIVLTDTLGYLRLPASQCFDVVFLDPPFHKDLLTPCTTLLEQGDWLTEQAHIYLECESRHAPQLPANWQLLRDKHAGQVHYQLWQRQPTDKAGTP